MVWEKFEHYNNGIVILETRGWKVKEIVCDGKSGLLKGFSIPVKMCRFHQRAVVTRYVTRRPKLQAGKDLQLLMWYLAKVDEMQFILCLELWHENKNT